jgi:uncharacterized membrane protein YidH (DUF202 family)
LYAGARFLITTKLAQEQRKKTQKNIYFCLRVKLFVYICTSNQQNRNTMKKETKNELINMALCVATALALVAFCILNLFLFNQ